MGGNIRVVVIDDNVISRDGLYYLLKKIPGVVLSGEEDETEKSIESLFEITPEVAFINLQMRRLDGLKTALKLLATKLNTKIIVLLLQPESQLIDQLINAGAYGCISANCSFPELEQAISSVTNNEKYLSTSIVNTLLKTNRGITSDHHRIETLLTKREKEVLVLLVSGMTVKEIALIFNLSVKTIETHRKNIMDKLNIHNIADLVKVSLKEGFTS